MSEATKDFVLSKEEIRYTISIQLLDYLYSIFHSPNLKGNIEIEKYYDFMRTFLKEGKILENIPDEIKPNLQILTHEINAIVSDVEVSRDNPNVSLDDVKSVGIGNLLFNLIDICKTIAGIVQEPYSSILKGNIKQVTGQFGGI